MVIRDFKVGDILICKKDSLIIKDEIWYWRPDMDMYKDVKYTVIEVDDYDIKVGYLDPIYVKYEYFGYDEMRENHWVKWFYTTSELRDIKLNELLNDFKNKKEK